MRALRHHSTTKLVLAAPGRRLSSQNPPTTSKVTFATDPAGNDDLSSLAELPRQPRRHRVTTTSRSLPPKDEPICPPRRRDLPVSPLMDPDFSKAKKYHRAVKDRPSKTPTTSHKDLSKNPYALALAYPMRLCHRTDTLLPKFFLQEFHFATDPEAGKPCYVPRGPYLEIGGDSKTFGPATYTLARQSLLLALQETTAGYGSEPLTRLLPARIRNNPIVAKKCNSANFRVDMHEFILELIRRRICERLLYLFKLKRGYITGFENWNDVVAYSRQAAIFLWAKGSGSGGNGFAAPGEFATMVLPASGMAKAKSRKVPVHNLRVLLGEEKLDYLRKASCNTSRGTDETDSIFQKPIISIKNRNMTTDLQLQLWWLQGYLAKHEDY